jgi:hypothetical protein
MIAHQPVEHAGDGELAGTVLAGGWGTHENVAMAVGFKAAFDFRQLRVVKHPPPDAEVELLLVLAGRKLDGETHWRETSGWVIRSQGNKHGVLIVGLVVIRSGFRVNSLHYRDQPA